MQKEIIEWEKETLVLPCQSQHAQVRPVITDVHYGLKKNKPHMFIKKYGKINKLKFNGLIIKNPKTYYFSFHFYHINILVIDINIVK